MRNCKGEHSTWWAGKFRNRGFKITSQREAVLEVLSNTDQHLSTEEVYFQLHQKCPGIGLATVYRTLELLVKLGIVQKFDFGDGRARYEILSDSKEEDHHHHLICKKCGTIIDYKDFISDEIELLNKTEKGLSEKYNFEITDHVIHFYGICEKCKQ